MVCRSPFRECSHGGSVGRALLDVNCKKRLLGSNRRFSQTAVGFTTRESLLTVTAGNLPTAHSESTVPNGRYRMLVGATGIMRHLAKPLRIVVLDLIEFQPVKPISFVFPWCTA